MRTRKSGEAILVVEVGTEYIKAAIEEEGGTPNVGLVTNIMNGVVGGLFTHIQRTVKREIVKQRNRNN